MPRRPPQPASPRRGGFTVPELLTVMLVLVGLMAVLSPSVIGYVKSSRYQVCVDELRTLEFALVRYYDDVGTLTPLARQGEPVVALEVCGEQLLKDDGQPGWNGPYLAAPLEQSPFGGHWFVEILGPDQAILHLGPKAALREHAGEIYGLVDRMLDGDGDVTRGIVWGDVDGLHVGFNFEKP